MSRTTALIAGVAAMLVVGGCSSSHPTGHSTSPAAHRVAATPPTTASSTSVPPSRVPSTPAADHAGLTGTWSGRYQGGYQGTFMLTWQQVGSKLTGTIRLSAPAVTLSIDGSVRGGAIRFGTVGSVGITYSGSVAGHSMSGSYAVAGSSGGSWTASRA